MVLFRRFLIFLRYISVRLKFAFVLSVSTFIRSTLFGISADSWELHCFYLFILTCLVIIYRDFIPYVE